MYVENKVFCRRELEPELLFGQPVPSSNLLTDPENR
jgi:hypothetical protein